MQSIHTRVLSILVNFRQGVLIKKKTPQEPLSIQVDLNRGIKEGLILLYLMKQLMKRKTKIHNTGFLINPTTHLFLLLSQSGSCGVGIKIALKYQIWNMEMVINQIILPCILELSYIEKR